MKRIILSLFMISTGLLFSQNNDQIENKKGIKILPLKGEFAIGIDASPFLRYIGDIFGSGSSNYALNGNKFLADYFGSNTIYGKYMLTDKNAIRANMRITTLNGTENFKVLDNSNITAGSDSLLTDKRITSIDAFSIGLGYEFRRGKSRIRGIYGGDIFFQTSKQQVDYSYGNGYSATNITPTSMFDSGGNTLTGFGAPVFERRKYDKGGRTYGVGLRAFVGIEYYIAPKICFGTEFGYGFAYTNITEGSRATEFYNSNLVNDNGTIGGVDERKVIFGKSSNFSTNTDNFNGALYLMFYF